MYIHIVSRCFDNIQSVGMQTLLVASLCACVCVCAERSPVLCLQQATVNRAVDSVLYFMTQNRNDYSNVSDVDKSFLKGSVQLHAKNGRFGRLHTLERVGDVQLTFPDNKMPTTNHKKVYAKGKGRFSELHLEYTDSAIQFIGCKVMGNLSVTVANNLFEVSIESSDNKTCLMDVRLIQFHKFGPIDFQISAAEGKMCASFLSKAVNMFVQFFREFTADKVKEKIIKIVSRKIPPSKPVLCLSNDFDVSID